MMGAPPLLIPATTLSKFARQGIILREKNRRFEEKKEKNKIPSSFNWFCLQNWLIIILIQIFLSVQNAYI